MPTFEVTLNGKAYDVDAPNAEAAAYAAGHASGQPSEQKAAKPAADVGADVLHSTAEGLWALPGQIAGQFGDAMETGAKAGLFLARQAGRLAGVPEERLTSPERPLPTGTAAPPTSRQVNNVRAAAEGHDQYQPQTLPGRIARTGVAMLPNAALPGSLALKTAMVAGPALGSELAGEATKGKPYEGAARVTGALVGGVAGGLATAPRAALPALASTPMNDLMAAFRARPACGRRPRRLAAAAPRVWRRPSRRTPIAGFRVRVRT
jgi:hypothetical protein